MRWLAALALMTAPALADSMVTTRTVKAQTILSAEDVTLVAAKIPGALSDPQAAIGRETRVTLYAGRPIRAEDLGAPTLVARNQTVMLVFQTAGLTIRAEGRALDRGAAGEPIRVMNLASRQTVSGIVAMDGTVRVGASQGTTE